MALLAAAGAAAVRVVAGVLRHRRLNQFAVLMLVVYGTGLLLAYALPVEVAVAATEGLLVATILLLAGWNAWYLRRARDVLAP